MVKIITTDTDNPLPFTKSRQAFRRKPHPNTLAESPECKDYPSVISGYLGKNWGILLGALYFVMLVIWMFVYSTAITNDSASYLHTFGVTEGLL